NQLAARVELRVLELDGDPEGVVSKRDFNVADYQDIVSPDETLEAVLGSSPASVAVGSVYRTRLESHSSRTACRSGRHNRRTTANLAHVGITHVCARGSHACGKLS